MANEKSRMVIDQAKMIDERDAAIASQPKMIDERDAAIAERDAAIASQAKMIDERDAAIARNEAEIDARDILIARQDEIVRNLEARVARMPYLELLEVSPKQQVRALARTVPASLRGRARSFRLRRQAKGISVEDPSDRTAVVDEFPSGRVTLEHLVATQFDTRWYADRYDVPVEMAADDYWSVGLPAGRTISPAHDRAMNSPPPARPDHGAPVDFDQDPPGGRLCRRTHRCRSTIRTHTGFGGCVGHPAVPQSPRRRCQNGDRSTPACATAVPKPERGSVHAHRQASSHRDRIGSLPPVAGVRDHRGTGRTPSAVGIRPISSPIPSA